MGEFPPATRPDDPETSHAAVPSEEDRRTLCMKLLRAFSTADLTAQEAADRVGLDRWQASKRVSDLIALGFVEPMVSYGRTAVRRGESGRTQRILTITDAGRESLSG